MFRLFICSDCSDRMYTRSCFWRFSDLYIGCYASYSQTGSQVTPSCTPSIPSFLMASWVCAGSSSRLLPLIYLARPDECKHLPGYPRHLGGRGVWMCFIFFLPHTLDRCFSTIFSAWSPSTFTPLPENPLPISLPANRYYGG